VENAGGHRRNPNDILGLLCREHFPRLVEYAGVTGPAYTFDHYAVAPDAVDRDNQEFNNKAERVKQELWVSLNIMLSHPGFRGPKPGREHNHQVCWDQVSHI
jgi:hypothetical protein